MQFLFICRYSSLSRFFDQFFAVLSTLRNERDHNTLMALVKRNVLLVDPVERVFLTSHTVCYEICHSSFSSEIKWLLSMHQVHAKLCCSTCTCIVMVDCYSVCFCSSEEEHQFQCSSSEGILEVTTHI